MTDGDPSPEELRALDGWWRACNYLAAGMIHLRDNPLLRTPLTRDHVKERLLGHWGSSPGLSFIYAHLNRLIRRHALDMIFVAGPGHGAPGVLGPVFLEGTYGELNPEMAAGVAGLARFLRHFSFPGGIGSHCSPAVPGSIHEGGELGYSLAHAFGAAFDAPELVVAVVIGDGEAETGPLATAWHSNKFLNPARDGAVLPILHLNGYKIGNPAILARIHADELDALLRGYGWRPYLVEGHEPMAMHAAMAAAMDRCVAEISAIRRQARTGRSVSRPAWPAIVLRTPKGWTGPAEVDGHRVEGTWRSHQVPLPAARDDPAQLRMLEQWLLSYRPDELFDDSGRLRRPLADMAPSGTRRMSANPRANGGALRRALVLPDLAAFSVTIDQPGAQQAWNTRPLGDYLREVMRGNPGQFRLFGPDETASNRLDAVFEVSGRTWMADLLPEDADGGALSPEGRVMEILSEHTLEGWLEGYLLTGRHGLFATYEAFAHVIGSMFNQHAKWLDASLDVRWRAPIASLNILLTSTVWRQDHNGFTHQDPGFIDLVVNKSPRVTRVYLPPDANSLLVTVDHCLRTTNRINVIVADKQRHLQFLDLPSARAHFAAGVSRWHWASSDQDGPTDAVLAACGDVATQEALAAAALLRELVPDLRLRFLNVSNLHAMTPPAEHPDGLTDDVFDQLFTLDKPIVFCFHGYPWLVHRLSYRRTNHAHLHVRGYKEKGGINTPLELAILNEVDRFSLAIDVIDRTVRRLPGGRAAVAELRTRQADCVRHARERGVDQDLVRQWRWPS